MGGFVEVLNKLPPWAGNVPVWILLAVVIAGLVREWLKTQPVREQQKIDERLKIKEGYMGRINDLEDAVRECQRECEQHKKELREVINKLQDRVNNEARQRVQGEISLVSTLLKVVDAPQLKIILAELEKRQTSMALLNVQLLGSEGADDAEGN
jgi:hypothetical protein